MRGDGPSNLDGIERVVTDDLRFKRRLAIGDEAYASLKLGKRLYRLWDIGGVAATGGAIAASATVASTFFAPKGLLAAIGLGGAAATPIGWIAAATLATGGVYYGVTRLLSGYSDSRVEVIPRFINTPVDVLGLRLLDLMGMLAIKLAQIDGSVSDDERRFIAGYYTAEWGFDPGYLAVALDRLAGEAPGLDLAQATAVLAEFMRASPDCNYAAMHAELLVFLRELAACDRAQDERELMAIERIDSILRKAVGPGRRLRAAASLPGRAAGRVAGLLRRKA